MQWLMPVSLSPFKNKKENPSTANDCSVTPGDLVELPTESKKTLFESMGLYNISLYNSFYNNSFNFMTSVPD